MPMLFVLGASGSDQTAGSDGDSAHTPGEEEC